MILKLSALINDFNGLPIKMRSPDSDKESDLRLKDVCVFTLMACHKERDVRLDGASIHRQYQLAKKIQEEKGDEIELSYKEVELIKARVRVVYAENFSVIGAVYEMLS